MNSFNVFGQASETIGGNTPVWLGTVKPVPVGATFYVPKGTFFKAGTPVVYDAVSKTVTTFDTVEDAVARPINGFIYNDVYSEKEGTASVAVVMYHPEGLLIERVYPEITEEQIATLQAKIPGVLLVRG